MLTNIVELDPFEIALFRKWSEIFFKAVFPKASTVEHESITGLLVSMLHSTTFEQDVVKSNPELKDRILVLSDNKDHTLVNEKRILFFVTYAFKHIFINRNYATMQTKFGSSNLDTTIMSDYFLEERNSFRW